MFPKMQLLFTTLANIIIQYCDPSNAAVKIEFPSPRTIHTEEQGEYVETKSFDDHLFSDLKERIENSISSHRNKINRASLMFYLLHYVDKIRPLLENPHYLKPNELDTLQCEMIQLITEMKDLLRKSKTDYIEVKYGEQQITDKIYGFRIGFFGISNSGAIIQSLLFQPLTLSSPGAIKQYIADVFKEYQHTQRLHPISLLKPFSQSNTRAYMPMFFSKLKLEGVPSVDSKLNNEPENTSSRVLIELE